MKTRISDLSFQFQLALDVPLPWSFLDILLLLLLVVILWRYHDIIKGLRHWYRRALVKLDGLSRNPF